MTGKETKTTNWQVAGHAAAKRSLASSLNTPSHAYLFVGPKRVGKRTLAIEFAKALNCEAEESDRPCQQCPSCRLIAKMGHADVSELAPEGRERILVEEVRQLRQALALLPSQGRWRVVIVSADAMTEGAADALLKTLEEPNSRVVLLLTGHDLGCIPDTIVSRCRQVVLSFTDESEIRAELLRRGVESERAAYVAALSFGAMGWAIEGASDGDLAERRASIRDDLAHWGSNSLLMRLDAAESLAASSGPSDKTRALVIEELEIMMTWWRDLMLASVGLGDLIGNSTLRVDIETLAQQESPARALQVIRAIALAASRINENVDPRLTLESLAFAM